MSQIPPNFHDDDDCGRADLAWYPDADGRGWHCLSCNGPAGGEPPGHRPDLDRELVIDKVLSLNQLLHDQGLVRFDHPDDAATAVQHVSRLCRATGRYDQLFIVMELCQRAEAHWKAAAIVVPGDSHG